MESHLTPRSVRPAQNSHRAKRVPATRQSSTFFEREVEMVRVRYVLQPAAVRSALPIDERKGLVDPRVCGFARGAEVVEAAQHVVVVAGRKCKVEKRRVRHGSR